MSWHLSVVGVMHVLNWSAIDHLSEFIELILVQFLVVLNTISILINNSSWLELRLDEVLMWLIGLSKVNLMIWNIDHTVRLSKVIEMLELDGRDPRRVEEGKSHS
jgi:hypothetical protein